MPGATPRLMQTAEAAPTPPERRAWEPDPLSSGQDADTERFSTLPSPCSSAPLLLYSRKYRSAARICSYCTRASCTDGISLTSGTATSHQLS
jgi:hypothetical protein